MIIPPISASIGQKMISRTGKLPGPATMNPSILSSFNEINILFLLLEQKMKVFRIKLVLKKNIRFFLLGKDRFVTICSIFAIKEYGK